MKKKTLSILLLLVMLLSLLPTAALAENVDAPHYYYAYVTIADKGSVVMAQQKVGVADIDGDGKITVNDTLYAAHKAAYEGGAEAGYSSYTSDYGLSLGTLWGDNSGNFGYWVENVSCWSLADEVPAGEHVVAFIYSDSTNYSDAYAKFDSFDYSATVNTAKTVSLESAGYDENWATVFSAYADADLTAYDSSFNALDSADYTVTNNTDGTYDVTFSNAGSYYLVATAENNAIVPAVCAFTVEDSAVSGLPFVDVDGHWALDAITYVYENELFNGVGDDRFAPDENMTRAMLITVLARLDGQDTTGGETWYEKAVAWAVANDVSDGTMLDVDVTREQMVTMLWRYAGSPESEKTLNDFTDAEVVNSWAVEAMQWAVSEGLITGRTDTTLVPDGTATRAEVATVLQRFAENIEK